MKGIKEMTEQQMIDVLFQKGYIVYRPELMQIGGESVPKPMMTPPPGEITCWHPNISGSNLADFFTWTGDYFDIRILNRGLCHLTREAAQAHAKALIKVSGGCA